jgi:hypothetical protein
MCGLTYAGSTLPRRVVHRRLDRRDFVWGRMIWQALLVRDSEGSMDAQLHLFRRRTSQFVIYCRATNENHIFWVPMLYDRFLRMVENPDLYL